MSSASLGGDGLHPTGYRNDQIPAKDQHTMDDSNVPDFTRTVKVTKRVVSYIEEEVCLLKHLIQNACEVYVSAETRSVEIRMPGRIDNYTHFVADIPVGVVDVEWVKAAIRDNRENQIFERYIDHVCWRAGYNDTVFPE